MGRRSSAPPKVPGRSSSMAAAMLAPLEKPTATGAAGPRSYVRACRVHEVRQLVRAPAQVVEVEHAFGEPPEEPGHAVLQDLTPRAQLRGPGQELLAQGQQIVLRATRPVEQQERREPGALAGTYRWMNPSAVALMTPPR